MRLSELIHGDLIKVGLEAVGKREAIEELADLLISAHEIRLGDREEVLDALLEREGSLSTGLDHGIAVPHGFVDCVDEVIAALGTSQEGIPFDSTDGKPARLVVLLLLPKGRFQRHVHTLAGIAGLGADAELRESIFEASTPEEVMEAIHEADDVGRPKG